VHLAGQRRAASEVERPARLGRLEINYTPLDPVAVGPRSVERYAALGVDRLVVCPLPFDGPSDVAGFLERHAALPHRSGPLGPTVIDPLSESTGVFDAGGLRCAGSAQVAGAGIEVAEDALERELGAARQLT
jgi:hypothetical protein